MIESEVEVPRPSMKERQRQFREDAILDAAVDFLQTKGFTAMTLDDITESIGISRPTLYQHFSSKEEMVVQVLIRNVRRGVEKLRALEAESRPALDRLMDFLDWSMQTRFGSCRSVFTDLGQILIAAKENNETYRSLYFEFKARFAGLIEKAQADGEVRSDIRAQLLAEAVMSIYKSPGFDELMQKGQTSIAEVRDCLYRLLRPC